MARVSINNTTFTPFTFDEILKPLAMYGLEYRALEEAISALRDKTSILDMIASSEPDSKAYMRYKLYSDDLRNQADALAKNGLPQTGRNLILDLRSRYNSEINPIEVAFNRKKELVDAEDKARLADRTLEFDSSARDLKIDDIIANPLSGLGKSFSGALMTKMVADSLSGYKNRITDIGKLEESGIPFNYILERRRGASPEQVMAAIYKDAVTGKDKGAVDFLNSVVSQVMDVSGVSSWTNEVAKKRMEDFAMLGLYQGIGGNDFKDYKDEYSMSSALDKLKRSRDAADAAKNNSTLYGNLPINTITLESPNQEGSKKSEVAKILQSRLGMSGNLNGVFGKTITLDLYYKMGDIGGMSEVKNTKGTKTFKILDDKGNLISREEFIKLGGNSNSRKQLGIWYDKTYEMLEENIPTNRNGKYNVRNIATHLKDMYAGKGGLDMGAIELNFGADGNKKILEGILPKLTDTEGKLRMKEITKFDRQGDIKTGSRVSLSDVIDESDGTVKKVVAFYAPPNPNVHGLITQIGAKKYFIESKDLGSLAGEMLTSAVQLLTTKDQKATLMLLIKDDVKKRINNGLLSIGESVDDYVRELYYNSPEGVSIENALNNYGASFVRTSANTLGYKFNIPSYNVSEQDKKEQ